MAPLFCSYCHLVTKVCKKGQAVQILFRPCFSYKLTLNFCKDIRKMIYGIIPSKWDTVWQNQCPNSKVKNLTVIKFDFCISIKTAFQRPKAGSYETGDKMSLTHHKQIDQIRPRLDVRSETPFQFCLSHAVNFDYIPILSVFFVERARFTALWTSPSLDYHISGSA